MLSHSLRYHQSRWGSSHAANPVRKHPGIPTKCEFSEHRPLFEAISLRPEPLLSEALGPQRCPAAAATQGATKQTGDAQGSRKVARFGVVQFRGSPVNKEGTAGL